MVDRNFNQKGLEGHSELKDIKQVQYNTWYSLHFAIPREASQLIFLTIQKYFFLNRYEWRGELPSQKRRSMLQIHYYWYRYQKNFSTLLTDYNSWIVSFRGENSKAFAFHYIFMKYKNDLQIMIYRKRPLGSRVKSFLASHILRYKFYSKSTELVKTIRHFLKTLVKYNRN